MSEVTPSPENKSRYQTWEQFEVDAYQMMARFRADQYRTRGIVIASGGIHEKRTFNYTATIKNPDDDSTKEINSSHLYEFHETPYGFFTRVTDARRPPVGTKTLEIDTSPFTGVELTGVFEYVVKFEKSLAGSNDKPFVSILFNPSRKPIEGKKNTTTASINPENTAESSIQEMLYGLSDSAVSARISKMDGTPLDVWHPAQPEINFAQRLYDHIYRVLIK